MYNKRKGSAYRRLAITLLILCLVFLVTIINSSIIFAQRQNKASRVVVTATAKTGTNVSTPTLNITIYLPIIFRSPAAIVSTNCNPTEGSGGFAPGTYDTVVAGLNAIVVVGEGYNPQEPTFLGFNLHGDGGQYDLIKSSSNALNQVANEHGWILVSPQSPNGQSWWTNWEGDHNEKLADVFDSMFASYNVCRDIILGTTGSGGSEFWTAYFFPAKGGEYQAHTLIACGGNDGHDSNSRNQINALGQKPDVVARSSFYYVYGTEDSLVPGIEDSIELYDKAGFDVSVDKIEGAGHCNVWKQEGFPSWHERAATYWEELVNQLSKN